MTSAQPADVVDLFGRAATAFGERVHGVRNDQWSGSTPCTKWDVRALVNHLVYEMRWAVPLFEGSTIADVGDRFEGDLLGNDPVATWDDAGAAAVSAVSEPGVMQRTVHLSFGDVPGEEYAWQLFADLTVHGWDLARATGQEERIEPALLGPLRAWFADRVEGYRSSGATGPRPDIADDADEQTTLLADFGRTA